MKRVLYTALILALIIIIPILTVDMWKSVKGIKYYSTKEKSYEPFYGSIDIYNAREKDLKKASFVKYDRVFGQVPDERSAVRIAGLVADEIYKNCSKDEEPFEVYYNKNAEAWIVHGNLPSNTKGGVASIAIKRDTGEILLLMHTK